MSDNIHVCPLGMPSLGPNKTMVRCGCGWEHPKFVRKPMAKPNAESACKETAESGPNDEPQPNEEDVA